MSGEERDDDPFPDRSTWLPPPSQEYQDQHGWKDGKPPENGHGEAGGNLAGLADILSATAWMKRVLPKPKRLLGDLLTTTSRVFLIGATGMGKTHIALAAGVAMVARTGFLHWHAAEAPARVLYIDGEMPAEQVQRRIADAARRLVIEHHDKLSNLFVYSRDWAEELARIYPDLGVLEPLNTEAGQNFIKRLVAIVRPDAIVFDNVMSLITGDQKDEVPWSETLPLVTWLTSQQVGQLWCDHTGWNNTRQYGSSTKAWRFDAAGIMTPALDAGERELAFVISFDAPGKARRRTPENWDQFAPHIVRLVDDVWTSEPVEKTEAAKKTAKLSPMDQAFHNALVNALAVAEKAGETTIDAWIAECVRLKLIEDVAPKDSRSAKDRKRSLFRKHRARLIAARMVACDGERVVDLRHPNA
jgi:putative DNA primase/helicase